jgi:hypothetical protein
MPGESELRRRALKWMKRPVIVEAIEVYAWDAEQVAEWCGGVAVRNEIHHCLGIDIPTLEGTMRANLGDWIIKGVKGEFYPCKPDIFAASYQLVNEVPE